MNHLLRKLAPISSAAWSTIEDEAKRVLKLKLAARKVVDFAGPLGFEASAVNLGRVASLKSGPTAGVGAALRQVQPLVELRVDFELARADLDDIARGRKDPDVDPLIDAATRIAHAEDSAVFHGYAAGGIRGIADVSSHPKLTISDAYDRYPQSVAEATRLLRVAGVDGPYAIALGPRCYTGLMQATGAGGYPVLELVRRVIDGPIIWAPAVNGAVVVSLRGGDFEITVGQDLSIGYAGHDERKVQLYLLETFTFRVLTPEAGIALAYKNASAAAGSTKGARRRTG
jgi:uncharacterized linocin/CFP29 family protein